MPNVTLAIPQSHETVTRNVVKSVVGSLMESIDFSTDTDVIYREGIGGPPTTGGTVNPTAEVKLTHDNHVVVSYEELYTEPGVLTSIPHGNEVPFIFRDPDLGILIRPIYGKVKMELAITLNFRDRSSMNRYKRLFRMQHGRGVLTNNHTVSYEYSMHDDLLSFLYDAHAMQRPVGGSTETLNAYLQRCFLKGLARRSNRSGERTRLVLGEEQGNVVGMYDNEMFYNNGENEEGNNTLTFNYNFEYDQILGTTTKYPNVIHNRRIPKRYRKAWAVADIPTFEEDALKTLSYMPPLWQGKIGKYYRGLGGYKMDPTDEWEPRHKLPNIRPIVLTPIMVNEADLHIVLNLSDFNEEQLPTPVRSYILKYPAESTVIHTTMYHVQLFSVGSDEIDVTIEIDPDGTIRSVLPLNPLRRHYLRISMMSDLSKLPTAQVADMLASPVETLQIFKYLHPNVEVSPKPLPYADSAGDKYTEVVLAVVGTTSETVVVPKGEVIPESTDNTVALTQLLPNGDTEVTIYDISDAKLKANSFRMAVKKLATTNTKYAAIWEINPRLSSNINIISSRN